MSTIKDFADQLHKDVLADMADAYFGTRKDLETSIEAYLLMVEDFKAMIPRLQEAVATLHSLLLDELTIRDFYISLDILPSCIPSGSDARGRLENIPFAWTASGRYRKCVLEAYDNLQEVADEYLNGKYVDDQKQPGRKRLTVHYLRLKALAEHINDQVRMVNEDMSASAMLRQVKGMDPEEMTKEEIMGSVSYREGCDLDRNMCFTPLDFEGLDLPVVQDLPKLDKVREDISNFCNALILKRKEDIARAMSSLESDKEKVRRD